MSDEQICDSCEKDFDELVSHFHMLKLTGLEWVCKDCYRELLKEDFDVVQTETRT